MRVLSQRCEAKLVMRLLLQKLNYSRFEAFEKHHKAVARLCTRRCQPRIRLLNQASMESPAVHHTRVLAPL